MHQENARVSIFSHKQECDVKCMANVSSVRCEMSQLELVTSNM